MNRPCIYQDETTFHSWMQKAKSWSRKDSPVYHARNNKRVSTTVYGAIGHCLQHGVFVLGRSTNQNEFQEFLRQVKAAVKPQFSTQKPFFLYDQASAHTAAKSQKMMKEFFTPLPIPVMSCEFNSK